MSEDALNTFYWVCAYANRQWRLAQQVTSNPKDASFYKAMEIAMKKGGVLLILDDTVTYDSGTTGPATAFTRIWCGFEESMALEKKMKLDIAAVHDGRPETLTEGMTKYEEDHNDS